MDKAQLDIEQVKKIVDTARQEIELAIMFHETWRPAAYDTDLHIRIGTSYAAHAFQITRLSLRRELLLALTRVWDSNRKAVRMSLIRDCLRDKEFFDSLVQYRTARMNLGSRFIVDEMHNVLTTTRNQVLELIDKYSKDGAAFEVLEKLKVLRNQHLAHRQLPQAPIAPAGLDAHGQHPDEDEPSTWASDDEVETFYQDNLEIVRLLLSLMHGMAYDLSEASDVYRHHARYFWASVRGERTEGHPDYHPPPSGS